MATHIIGDVHGAYHTLRALLDALDYSASRDRLCFVGDLVNNGPRSRDVLRFVADQGDRAITTLGNHDLHLLAVTLGGTPPRKKDTFQELLDAPDCEELSQWLRAQPLIHLDERFVMVHAGLLPEWSLDQAARCAAQVEQALRHDDPRTFFDTMYGNEPDVWREGLDEVSAKRLTVNVMTRMRALHPEDHRLDFAYKGTLPKMPEGLAAWFELTRDAPLDRPLFFGHWSALGLHQHQQIWCLDSGCTWGERLTAYTLETGAIHQVPTAAGEAAPSAR